MGFSTQTLANSAHMKELIPKKTRRFLRRTGVVLGIAKDWEAIFEERSRTQGEQSEEWYDYVYGESKEYQSEYYESPYYFLWTILLDRIRKLPSARILEIGCGSGQFARLLAAHGFKDYLGFDFSRKAIELAQISAPEMEFVVADALQTELLERTDFGVIICTEVLEHIEQDLKLLERIPAGMRCLCTVPNFPHYSHVRHFENLAEVSRRYESLFTNFDVLSLHGIRNKDEVFYLFDGLKS